MFEGDSADTYAEKFPLVSMGGQAEGLTCADPGARTPIGASVNSINICFLLKPSFIEMLCFPVLKDGDCVELHCDSPL